MSRKKWKPLSIGETEDIARRYMAGQRPKSISIHVGRPVKTIYVALAKRGIVLRGQQRVNRITEPRPQAAVKMAEASKPAGAFGLPVAPGLFDSAAAARARMMAGR